MKKIFALLITLVLISGAFSVLASANTQEMTFTFDFNNADALLTQYPTGGTCADSSKANGANTYLGEAPYGLQIKTMKDEVARRTILGKMNGDNNGVIPAGKYEISLWVRHNPASSSDWVTLYDDGNAYGEIIFSLYDATAVNDDTLTVENGFNIKLLPQNKQDVSFTKTDEKTYSIKDGQNDKEWYKYTATVTTEKEYSQFAFWCISNNDAKSLYAYVDDLMIKSVKEPEVVKPEENDPTENNPEENKPEENKPADTKPAETTPADTTAKDTAAATNTEAATTDATASEGCGSVIGAGISCVALVGIATSIAATKKRKDD